MNKIIVERWAARLDWMGFAIWDFSTHAIVWIFFLGDLLMTGRLLFIGAFAIYDRFRQQMTRKPASTGGKAGLFRGTFSASAHFVPGPSKRERAGGNGSR